MMVYDSMESLSGVTREAVVSLLYRLADDELIMGRRTSQQVTAETVPQQHVALMSMARDECDHARAYYEMLHRLGEPDPDTLIHGRSLRQFRCASFVCLPDGQDRVSCILRQFLYNTAETVRSTALCASTLPPLADLAGKLLDKQRERLARVRRWVLDLGRDSDEDRERLQTVLTHIYPHALGLFEPTESDVPLAQAGICPSEDELRRQWESAVAPVLADVGVGVPETVQPVHGGRVGRHLRDFAELLRSIQRADLPDAPTAP